MEIISTNFENLNVKIYGTYENPLFKASDIGNLLGIVKIRNIIENFDEECKVLMDAPSRGGIQKQLFLTEDGLYEVLCISRKPIAKRFRVKVREILKDLRLKGEYRLKKELAEKDREIEFQKELVSQAEEIKTMELEILKEKTLLDKFPKDTLCIYYGKIDNKGDNGEDLIKFGYSNDLPERIKRHKKTFENFKLHEVFSVNNPMKIENLIKKHDVLSKQKRTITINNSNQTELLIIDSIITCDILNDYIKEIIEENEYNVEKYIKLERKYELKEEECKKIKNASDTYKLEMIEYKEKIENEIKQYKNIIKNLRGDSGSSDEELLPGELLNLSVSDRINMGQRKHTQSRGTKIQRYSHDGKRLLKTYSGYKDASRDISLDSPTPGAIKTAIKRNTLYRKFRWASLDRSFQDDTFQDLSETVKSTDTKTRLIAMLNLSKDTIEHVFCDQKEVCVYKKVSPGSVSNAIKRNSTCQGNYFIAWEECANELKDKYLETNILPEKREKSTCIGIDQYQISDDGSINVIKQWESMSLIQTMLKVSINTIKKNINDNTELRGFLWRYTINDDINSSDITDSII